MSLTRKQRENLDKARAPEKVTFYANEWFDRVNGNSYFAVIVLVDGVEVYRSTTMEYGYGSQYEHRAYREYLRHFGIEHAAGGGSGEYSRADIPGVPWQFFRDNEIDWDSRKVEGVRKRDLFNFGPLS